MAGRHFHLSNGSLFLLLLVTGFVLLLLPRSLTQEINFFFAKTFDPLIRIGRQFQHENVLMAGPDEQYVLSEEHNKLWKNYNNLHAQLMKLQEQVEILSHIRSGLPRFFSGLVIAEVTDTSSGLIHELMINKGAVDGIQTGYYVMSSGQNSIIGVVRETSDKMARVRLLTDTNQSVEVRIRRDETEMDVGGLMFGDGKRGGIISMVEREKDIRIGDAVYAAARPGVLDTAMIIGQVLAVQTDEGSPLLWKIAVQPAEDARELKTVAVIVPETVKTEGQ